jgi:hypothetical protein
MLKSKVCYFVLKGFRVVTYEAILFVLKVFSLTFVNQMEASAYTPHCRIAVCGESGEVRGRLSLTSTQEIQCIFQLRKSLTPWPVKHINRPTPWRGTRRERYQA